MSSKEDIKDAITERMMNEPTTGGGEFILAENCDIEMFTTGPGAVCPGLSIRLDNGDRYNFTFATTKPIIELHRAMASHMMGTATRMSKLFETLHNDPEFGCRRTHKLFDETIEASGEEDLETAMPFSGHKH